MIFGDPRLPARFWAKLTVNTSGCWIWTGSEVKGYGRASIDGRVQMVHRITWEKEHGPVPAGLDLDHFRCDTRACANDAHVRPATRRENVLRGMAPSAANAAKEHCPRGHSYTEHGYVNQAGGRRCRICQRIHDATKRARQIERRLLQAIA